MPYLTLEYTDNLTGKVDFRQLFFELHSELFAAREFVLDEIKSRAIALRDFYIGDRDPEKSFVHLKISLLDSRSGGLKKSVAK